MYPENGKSPRNDIFAFADSLAEDPKYSNGALVLRDVTQALIENGDLPETILIHGVDSEVKPVEKEPIYRHPLFEHDRKTQSLNHSGHTFYLTSLENELLALLEDTPNLVVAHETINRTVWGYENYGESALSKGHISRIKSVLPFYDSEGNHEVIRSIKGVGYQFKDSSYSPKEIRKGDFSPKESDRIVYTHRLFEFVPDEFLIKVEGKDIILTPLEKRLMESLFNSKGGYVSPKDLMKLFDSKYNATITLDPNNLKTHISHIRKKIKNGRELDEPIIESKVRVGYRLNP